jgi:ParB-like chromosome segregation protein Spo0J
MDAFYVQRLLDGDLKSVLYDFRKLNLQPKRALRLLEDAVRNAPLPRATDITSLFATDFPELRDILAKLPKPGSAQYLEGGADSETATGPALPAQLTPVEEDHFPLQGVEWRDISSLTGLGITFRQTLTQAPEDMAHIRQIAAHPAESWPPVLITTQSEVIDGERRIAAARAQGVSRLLCQVRLSPNSNSLKQLRVCLNSRVRPLDKIELYFAIGALTELGLTQGAIATALGTSRPNVIVYAKVKEKATPRLRQLYEDGLIQITNASSAVDLPAAAQDEMADFIRQYGAGWGRGPQFNELYAAAAEGQIAALVPQSVAGLPQPAGGTILPLPSMPAHIGTTSGVQLVAPPGALSPTLANALKKRQEALETALRDSETWARQREATIASQTTQIHDLRQQVESFKREMEAQSLLQHGDSATMANYLKEIKAFYAVQERLAGAIHQLEKTQTAIRSLHLTHRQTLELEQMLEKVASVHTALRVALVKSPTPSSHSAGNSGS